MKKLFILSIAIAIGTLGCQNKKENGGNITPSETSVKNSLDQFNLTVDSIKYKIGIEEKSIGLYFQRVWAPTEKKDSCSIRPELFAGEFISSKREIEYTIPTCAPEQYSMGIKYDDPEDIIFMPEKKESDTIFFYAEYNRGYKSQNATHIAEPIACITPTGKIVALGEYLISQEFLTQKITGFLNEVVEKDKQKSKMK
jgi:hypothetical protein